VEKLSGKLEALQNISQNMLLKSQKQCEIPALVVGEQCVYKKKIKLVGRKG